MAKVLFFDIFFEKDPHLNAVELYYIFVLSQFVYIFCSNFKQLFVNFM